MLLVRESSGDLFAVEPLAEVGRDDRVLENFVSTTPITVTRGGQSALVDVAALGDRRVIVADSAQGASVLVLGGDEPNVLLAADAFSLSAAINGGVLYVREERGSSQRCHRGDATELERVYRGDYCDIASSGHILGGTVTASGAHDVTVLDPGGDELLNSSFDQRPEISNDGRYLLTTDNAGVAVIRVADGETLWELSDGRSVSATAADGRLAVTALDRDGMAVLVVLSADGDPHRLESIEAGDIRASLAAGGDLYWIADGAMWVNPKGSSNIEELVDADDLHAFDMHNSGAITAIADDFGVRLDRHAPGKEAETLHELDDPGLTYWLIADDDLYLATATLASIVPLDDGNPADSERWDAITVHDARNGTLVASGNDSGYQTLFTLQTNGTITEFDEYDHVHSAQVHGSTLYATVTTNNSTTTIAYDIKTVEQHTESDYHNYTLTPNVVQPQYTTLIATADFTPPALRPADESPIEEPFTESPTEEPLEEKAPAFEEEAQVEEPFEEKAFVEEPIIEEPFADETTAFIDVAAGGNHSCGLQTDNIIQCWGWNDWGQADAPGGQFTAVTAGSTHSCGLQTDNTIQCWGWNRSGQADAPGGQFTAVIAGHTHSCGLQTDNTIRCWGSSREGLLSAPGGQFLAITTGHDDNHSCGLRIDNTIQCWGNNDFGQADAPDGQFLTVTTGVYHSCGLRIDNTIQCWGYSEADAPDGQFLTVTAGLHYSCGLRIDNTIQCWGNNDFGQADAPDGQFLTVTAGFFHTCGLSIYDTIQCWGDNSAGKTDAP